MRKLVQIQLALSLIILLATGVRASQESYERLTIKPDTKLQFDASTKALVIRKVLMLKNMSGRAIVIVEVEAVDDKGKQTTKAYESNLEGGHGYYYEMITEDMKVKGKVTTEPTR